MLKDIFTRTRVDIFDKFRDFIHWASIDGYTPTTLGGASAVTPQGAMLELVTDFVTGNHAHLCGINAYQDLVVDGKLLTVEWIIMYITSVTNVTRRLHLTDDVGAPPADIADHFGFKIVDGDIFASSADGAVQESTDTLVNLGLGGQITRLRAVLNRDAKIDFYVNDVLKATHTTRFPAEGALYLNMGVITDEDVSKDMYLGRSLMEREY